MKRLTRRQMGLLLPAIAAAEQSGSSKVPSTAFKFEDLEVKVNQTSGSKARAMLKGESHSGYPLEVHMTELPAGQEPHPPHKHVHEEMMLLKEGNLDVTLNGKTSRLGPGSAMFAASNDLHGWRNPGPGSAVYWVVALGPDT